MARISPAFLCVVALLFAVLTACKAHAETTFGCQFVWNEASADNSISNCLKHPNFSTQWILMLLPAISCIVCITACIFFPIILCCRSCCCSVQSARPKTKEGRERAGCWLYMWIFVAVMFSIAVCIFIIAGSYITHASCVEVINGVEEHTINKFTQVLQNVNTYNKQAKNIVDTAPFQSVLSKMENIKDNLHKYFIEYLTTAEIIVDIAGALGILCLILVLGAACCKCTGMGLGVFTVIYVVFSIIYALLAVAFTIFMYFVIAGCGEITQQYHRAPGIGQWYYVPWYQKNFNFDSQLSSIEGEISSMQLNLCEALTKYCSFHNVYNDTDDRIYYCEFQSIAGCTEVCKLGNLFDTQIYIKPILANLVVTNTSGWDVMPNVTVSECATRCSDTFNLKPREVTETLNTLQNKYNQHINLVASIKQINDSNLFLDTIFWSTQEKEYLIHQWKSSGMQGVCANMTTASILLGVGFLVGAVMFLIGFYVLQKGSFIWIRKTEYDAPSSSSDSDFE